MEFHHKPVLFEETIRSLAIRPEGTYIDGTMGGGGHSEAILKQLTTGAFLSPSTRNPDSHPGRREAAGPLAPGSPVRGNPPKWPRD